MVKRRSTSPIADEFAEGLLPSLGRQTPAPQSPAVPAVSLPKPTATAASARRKINPYVDDPYHIDLIDALLTALRPYGIRRDVSMLIRALLNQAADALNDPAKLEALAEECRRTPPDR